MRREDFYILSAPIFATYLGAVSGSEALKYTSFNVAELDEKESRRLFISSLMSSPSSLFLEDKEDVARQVGYALAQEEAGVDRSTIVHSFLESMKALASSKIEAKMRLYESIASSLGAVFLLPLFLLFLWAIGILVIDPLILLALVYGITMALGIMAIVITPTDLDIWKTYEWSIPLGIGIATIAMLWNLPVAFLAFSLTTWLWLKIRNRLWWFNIRREVPPMLRSVAAMLKEGAPPELILSRLMGVFKTAAKIAYGYYVPSRYFVLAKAMYKAIIEAGGSTAIKSVEYIQSIIDIETTSIRRMARLSSAYFALFIVAVIILSMAVSSAVKHLASIDVSYNPFFLPPPYDEVRQVLTTAMSLIAASYISVFLLPLGIHYSTMLGGAVGVVLQHIIALLI